MYPPRIIIYIINCKIKARITINLLFTKSNDSLCNECIKSFINLSLCFLMLCISKLSMRYVYSYVNNREFTFT